MKYKAKQKKLQDRVNHWENNPAIRQINSTNPGTHKKPGSQKGR